VGDALPVHDHLADLKSPYLVGHSSGVAELAASATRPPTIARAKAMGRARTGLARETCASMNPNISRWSEKSSKAACSRMSISSPMASATSLAAAVQPMCWSRDRW
jgi:hypothetical protein